jgi:hypothetical protein
MREVTLIGGPADGMKVEVSGDSALLVVGFDVPEGYVARYRRKDSRKRDNETFVFESLSKIIARLPMPSNVDQPAAGDRDDHDVAPPLPAVATSTTAASKALDRAQPNLESRVA